MKLQESLDATIFLAVVVDFTSGVLSIQVTKA